MNIDTDNLYNMQNMEVMDIMDYEFINIKHIKRPNSLRRQCMGLTKRGLRCKKAAIVHCYCYFHDVYRKEMSNVNNLAKKIKI